jgi:hypothetical protein
MWYFSLKTAKLITIHFCPLFSPGAEAPFTTLRLAAFSAKKLGYGHRHQVSSRARCRSSTAPLVPTPDSSGGEQNLNGYQQEL